LLEPFGITRFYTDDWGAYERHIEEIYSKLVYRVERGGVPC
jgi:insertion element IS1 protein InsB